MEIFKINKTFSIKCEYKKSKNGFNHIATLLENGNKRETTKTHYINRTWESYEFQSVLRQMLDKSKILNLTDEQKNQFLTTNQELETKKIDKEFRSIGAIAKMGDILCKDQKSKNDWKAKMLKAGLQHKGFIMPDDWDELDEEVKTKRLNGVINSLTISK